MRVELDVPIENPLDEIDLITIRGNLIRNEKYELLDYRAHNYLLIKIKINDFKIRIHEDGRCYIKKDFLSESELNEANLLANMLEDLKQFIVEMKIEGKFEPRKELNFNFRGGTAHNFFWEKYNEIEQIGIYWLNCDKIKTYTSEANSIYVKLVSF